MVNREHGNRRRHGPQSACGSKGNSHVRQSGTGEMGGYHASRAQRVDLLGHLGQEGGDQAGPRRAGVLRAQGRDGPPLLLDRLHPPEGQDDKPVGVMGP